MASWQRAKLDLDPIDGERIHTQIVELPNLMQSLLEKMKEILK